MASTVPARLGDHPEIPVDALGPQVEAGGREGPIAPAGGRRRPPCPLAESRTLESPAAAGWPLVPVNQPADVIAMLGFIQSEVMTHEGFTAVARSWEERFGAVVTSVYPAGLGFAVANPPRAEEQAVILAAEQTAFAPEEGLIGAPEELPALARQLRTGVPAAGGSRSRHYWLFGWPD